MKILQIRLAKDNLNTIFFLSNFLNLFKKLIKWSLNIYQNHNIIFLLKNKKINKFKNKIIFFSNNCIKNDSLLKKSTIGLAFYLTNIKEFLFFYLYNYNHLRGDVQDFIKIKKIYLYKKLNKTLTLYKKNIKLLYLYKKIQKKLYNSIFFRQTLFNFNSKYNNIDIINSNIFFKIKKIKNKNQ